MQQGVVLDVGDLHDQLRKAMLRSNECPLPGEKLHVDRCDELLERLPTGEPATVSEMGVSPPVVFFGRHIREESVADTGTGVPLVHGIYGFRKLGATSLVDTAGVDPKIAIAVLSCDSASLPDLGRELRIAPDRTEGSQGSSEW